MRNQRRILHLDMDAFFAAIEQRDNPFLRGKPVIIGGAPEGRGVVSTCSYEARKYGVRSAMPMAQAKRLCPHAVFVPLNGEKYAFVSRQLMNLLREFSPKVQPISVDEAFMDISGMERLFPTEEALGRAIKKVVWDKLRLTCSIGIAPTKVFAKMASGMQKPDGLTVIRQEEVETRIYSLPVEDLWGIGEKTAAVLRKLGIKTIGQLARESEARLKKVFGKNGELMVRVARGQVDSPVLALEELPPEKSVGHEHTFWDDTNDLEEIRAELLLLSQKVGRRLRKNGFRGRTVTVKLRYDNFQTTTHRTTLTFYTNNDMTLFKTAFHLFLKRYESGRKIRLIGISVSNLVNGTAPAALLPFEEELLWQVSDEKLFPVLDRIKDRFGEHAIWRTTNLILFRDR
jgi:nucleotidyltransferase/DNA polymerase involved in DNA repair